jgi:hypothetical protein
MKIKERIKCIAAIDNVVLNTQQVERVQVVACCKAKVTVKKRKRRKEKQQQQPTTSHHPQIINRRCNYFMP